MILILHLVALGLKFSNRTEFLSNQIAHKMLIKPAFQRSFSREESRLNFITLQSSGLKAPPWFQSPPKWDSHAVRQFPHLALSFVSILRPSLKDGF